jgi:hypothetical protein
LKVALEISRQRRVIRDDHYIVVRSGYYSVDQRRKKDLPAQGTDEIILARKVESPPEEVRVLHVQSAQELHKLLAKSHAFAAVQLITINLDGARIQQPSPDLLCRRVFLEN